MSAMPLGLPTPPGEVLRARYRGRLPHSLDDLAGPDHGTVQLPLHVAWSGQTAFDLDWDDAEYQWTFTGRKTASYRQIS
jgi:hypothetical protein